MRVKYISYFVDETLKRLSELEGTESTYNCAKSKKVMKLNILRSEIKTLIVTATNILYVKDLGSINVIEHNSAETY